MSRRTLPVVAGLIMLLPALGAVDARAQVRDLTFEE
jgi:hypothetical protein